MIGFRSRQSAMSPKLVLQCRSTTRPNVLCCQQITDMTLDDVRLIASSFKMAVYSDSLMGLRCIGMPWFKEALASTTGWLTPFYV